MIEYTPITVGFYDEQDRLITEVLLPDTAKPLPEIPEAKSVRLFKVGETVPYKRPEHGPGCPCETCIIIVCTSSMLDDQRVARKLLRCMGREASDVRRQLEEAKAELEALKSPK